MTINTPASHVVMVNGSTTNGQLVVPWQPVNAAAIEQAYEDDQATLAKHACGNLYTMNGRGSGPSV